MEIDHQLKNHDDILLNDFTRTVFIIWIFPLGRGNINVERDGIIIVICIDCMIFGVGGGSNDLGRWYLL
jgi:hypothetical protein